MNEDFLAAGAQIAVLVVDEPKFNAVMAAKLELPFPVLSDPGGEAIKQLGLWNEEEGNTRAGVVVLAPDGWELFRHEGQEDDDQPPDEQILAVVRAAGLPACRPGERSERRAR